MTALSLCVFLSIWFSQISPPPPTRVYFLLSHDPQFISKTFLIAPDFLQREQVSLLFHNILSPLSLNDDFVIPCLMILCLFFFFFSFVTAHPVVLYLTWEQQKAIHEACAPIRSKMADVELGVMPSELAPSQWHVSWRENWAAGNNILATGQSESPHWNRELPSQLTSVTDWTLRVQAQPAGWCLG